MSEETCTKVDAWLKQRGERPELKVAVTQLAALKFEELVERVNPAAKMYDIPKKDMERLVKDRRPIEFREYEFDATAATLKEVRQST